MDLKYIEIETDDRCVYGGSKAVPRNSFVLVAINCQRITVRYPSKCIPKMEKNTHSLVSVEGIFLMKTVLYKLYYAFFSFNFDLF